MAEGEASPARVTAATMLFGAGTAWAGGNVGPVVGEVASDLSISLSTVGLLAGTLFFGGIVAAALPAAPVAGRLGIVGAIRLACVLAGVGNLLFAVSPGFAGLAAGRVLTGLGLGLTLALALGPVFARSLGGLKLVGAFGAAISLGIAMALAVGSALADAGVDWRVGFGISALVAVSALPLLGAGMVDVVPDAHDRRFLARALRDPRVWRLSLLFIAILGVPLVVGAWLIQYLTSDAGIAAALAGALGFVLFALSVVIREVGGRLAAAGAPQAVLAGASPLLAAAGLALLALNRSAPAAAGAVLLMGAGFALPYAAMMAAAQAAYPEEPVATVALLSIAANGAPMVAIPALGSALSNGRAEGAFLILAAFVAVAGLANARSPRGATPAR